MVITDTWPDNDPLCRLLQYLYLLNSTTTGPSKAYCSSPKRHLRFDMEVIQACSRWFLGRRCGFRGQTTCWLDDENLPKWVCVFDDQLDRAGQTQRSQTLHGSPQTRSDRSILTAEEPGDKIAGWYELFSRGFCRSLTFIWQAEVLLPSGVVGIFVSFDSWTFFFFCQVIFPQLGCCTWEPFWGNCS